MNVLRLLTRLLTGLAAAASALSLRDLNRLEALYDAMGDEILRAELEKLRAGTSRGEAGRAPKIGMRWLVRYHDSPMLHALAIGLCLFNRYPCDLPKGSRAYDEQRLAALMLGDRQNVQMDTGEGKTYAIALGAVALLTEHQQVIILTANPFLAKRDIKRTRLFYDSAGIRVVFGIPSAEFH